MNSIRILILISTFISIISGCAFQDGGEVKSTSNLILENNTDRNIYALFVSEDQKNWGENRFLNSLEFSTGLPPGEKFYLTLGVCDLSLELRIDFLTDIITDTRFPHRRKADFKCNETVNWVINGMDDSDIN